MQSIGADVGSLSYLSHYPALRCLKLGHAHLNDIAVKNICDCSQLEDLSLAKNPDIDDKVIPYLKNLKNLKALHIDGTAITVEGVMALQNPKLLKLFLPRRDYSPAVHAQIQKKFPRAMLSTGYMSDKMDDDTKAIFSPLTR